MRLLGAGQMLARVAPALLLLRPTPRWRSCSPLGCAREEEDARFMQLALAQASLAFQAGEIPIGAVLVRGGECIAAERNRVEELQDASAHAEMLCLRSGSAALHSWRLLGTTLYVTVEPCPMCLAASHAFRIDRLVYGTVNPRLGAVESRNDGRRRSPTRAVSDFIIRSRRVLDSLLVVRVDSTVSSTPPTQSTHLALSSRRAIEELFPSRTTRERDPPQHVGC